MRKKILLMITCAIFIFTFSACYDSKELNDFSYVMLIGIDKGISDKLRITYVIPSLEEGRGSTGEGGKGQSVANKAFKSVTIDAPSFFAGIELATTNIPKMLNFMHAQFIVFSEEMARSGIVGEIIPPLIRSREIRPNIHVVISRGSAESFVKSFQSFTGANISRITTNSLQQADESGYFTNLNLYDFYDCLKSTYHQPIAIYGAVNNGENFKEAGKKWGKEFKIAGDYYAGDVPRKEGNKIDLLGLAIFNGDTMVGKLTGHESRILSIAKGIFKRGTFTIPDPKKPELVIPINTRLKGKPKVDIRFDGTRPIIHLKVELEGDILAIQSMKNYENPKMQHIVEKAFEKFIKEGLDRTVKKTQELNCDVFKFGQIAARQFATIQEWENYRWNDHYKNAKVTTEVKFQIRETGTQTYNSPIIFSEEKKE